MYSWDSQDALFKLQEIITVEWQDDSNIIMWRDCKNNTKVAYFQVLSYMSCVIFWVVLRRMVFNSRRFGTLCLFQLHRRVDAK
jgi:hypothetical protein